MINLGSQEDAREVIHKNKAVIREEEKEKPRWHKREEDEEKPRWHRELLLDGRIVFRLRRHKGGKVRTPKETPTPQKWW